jgi:cytochrome c oxidase assembly protein subunit 15
VASGLSERTDVSHVRLAAHLLIALLIFGAVVWTALDLKSEGSVRRRMPTIAIWSLAALGLQLLFGAFVAGLDAGHVFNEGYSLNTWPLMGGEIYPTGYDWLQPALRNFVDNPITVQFVHRWWAFVVLAFAVVIARQVKRMGSRRESVILHSVIGFQILLGIATLLTSVDIPVAAAHQGMAVLLIGAFLLTGHRIAVLRDEQRA